MDAGRLCDQRPASDRSRRNADGVSPRSRVYARLGQHVGRYLDAVGAEALADRRRCDLLQPRSRFYQPIWVRGLIVVDYLTLIRPEQNHDICVDA